MDDSNLIWKDAPFDFPYIKLIVIINQYASGVRNGNGVYIVGGRCQFQSCPKTDRWHFTSWVYLEL